MDLGKSLLVYNLYPRTSWKEVTQKLFSVVPHDDIVVHVSMPISGWIRLPWIKYFLAKTAKGKLRRVLFSANRKKRSETIGFDRVRKEIDLTPYDTLTYIHSKGTSKRRKNTDPVRDWTEVMRYFVVERHDLCQQAFSNGFWLYGINLVSHATLDKNAADKTTPISNFHFSGNFVTCNLHALREKFVSTPMHFSYFGVEQFWGHLCTEEKAYSPHQTDVDHYNQRYPAERYR